MWRTNGTGEDKGREENLIIYKFLMDGAGNMQDDDNMQQQ